MTHSGTWAAMAASSKRRTDASAPGCLGAPPPRACQALGPASSRKCQSPHMWRRLPRHVQQRTPARGGRVIATAPGTRHACPSAPLPRLWIAEERIGHTSAPVTGHTTPLTRVLPGWKRALTGDHEPVRPRGRDAAALPRTRPLDADTRLPHGGTCDAPPRMVWSCQRTPLPYREGNSWLPAAGAESSASNSHEKHRPGVVRRVDRPTPSLAVKVHAHIHGHAAAAVRSPHPGICSISSGALQHRQTINPPRRRIDDRTTAGRCGQHRSPASTAARRARVATSIPAECRLGAPPHKRSPAALAVRHARQETPTSAMRAPGCQRANRPWHRARTLRSAPRFTDG
jgi:hypothetical protein